MKWLKTTLEPLLAPSVTKVCYYITHNGKKTKYEDTCLITIETLKMLGHSSKQILDQKKINKGQN